MLVDLFSKTAVLALAAMAYATPFSFEAGDFEAGDFEAGEFEAGNFETGNFWPGNVQPGNAQPGNAQPGNVEAPAGDSSDFKSQMLAAHNWYRGQHSADALKWDDNLASKSLAWASKCSENPRHEPDQPYGENIAWGSGVSASYEWVNLWGKERVDYKFDRPGYNGKTGHFTQLVWKGTTRVGCAQTKCSSGSNVVCKYDPPGNMVGANNKYFRDNVGPQTSGQIRDEYRG